MRLLHYSGNPLRCVRSRQQNVYPDLKPNGLWVSVEGPDDWKHWCEAERFHPENLTRAYEITLAPDANILHLSSAAEIEAFHQKHRVKLAADASGAYIDWHKVAQNHQGIIIAPYQWELRFCIELIWYYAWDCASGCIWNAKVIADVRPISTEPAMEKE